MASILIAEDDKDTLDLLVRVVEEIGHEVLSAPTGERALDLCTPGVDLALLDYMLPGADGAAVAAELRMLGVPFMFISATGDAAAIARMVDLRPIGYVEKPFGLHGIRASIQAALVQAHQDPRNTLTRLVNQAVGMLMERHHVDNRVAFVMLRSAARNAGISVYSLAERMVCAHDMIYRQARSA